MDSFRKGTEKFASVYSIFPDCQVERLRGDIMLLSTLDKNHLSNLANDAPSSSLCDPKRVQKVGFAELVKNLVPLPASSTKRGRGVMLEAPGLD